MTKYCPTCRSEYEESVSTCPDDKTQLVNHKPKSSPTAERVDIYAAANVLEAERIVAFLSDESVESKFQENSVSQFPTLGDSHFIVMVKPKDKKKATQLINQARSSGILTTNGIFL